LRAEEWAEGEGWRERVGERGAVYEAYEVKKKEKK
jgi:hypothetical protein